MTTTQITAGSDLLHTLATITNRDEAGRHFTEAYPDDVIEALESQGMVEINRPIHEATGLPYGQQYWHLEVTELGRETVENLFDERDYAEEN